MRKSNEKENPSIIKLIKSKKNFSFRELFSLLFWKKFNFVLIFAQLFLSLFFFIYFLDNLNNIENFSLNNKNTVAYRINNEKSEISINKTRYLENINLSKIIFLKIFLM